MPRTIWRKRSTHSNLCVSPFDTCRWLLQPRMPSVHAEQSCWLLLPLPATTATGGKVTPTTKGRFSSVGPAVCTGGEGKKRPVKKKMKRHAHNVFLICCQMQSQINFPTGGPQKCLGSPTTRPEEKSGLRGTEVLTESG